MADKEKAPDAERQRVELFEEEEYKDGFNAKTIWGALFVGLVMLPGAIYGSLFAGVGMGGAAPWVTIILFVEIAKRSLVKMTRQEIIVLYGITGAVMAAGQGTFSGLIWAQYFVQSQPAEGFGIADQIPSWWAPKLGSTAYLQRTFFHPDWVVPIGLTVLTAALGSVCSLSMGYALFRVTSDVERLPFPMAPVHAAGATALAESSQRRETWRWNVFSTGAVIGICFACVHSLLPMVTGSLMGKPIMILKIPFFDLTQDISSFLPAAPLAIFPDLGIVLSGFIIPFWVVVGIFVSSITANLLMNPILYRYGILTSWKEGMQYLPTQMANSFDFWLSVQIGFSWMIAIIGFWSVGKAIIKARAERKKAVAQARRAIPEVPRGRGDIPIWLAFGLWFLGACGFCALCRILLPNFPFWIVLFFAFVFSPINSYIQARLIGTTGISGAFSLPYLTEGMYILFAKGIDVWFAPIPVADYGSGAQSFRQYELTRTKFKSIVKATVASFVILMFCSFLFWSLMWKFAPIPSQSYPFVQKMWPYNATMSALWISSTAHGKGVTESFLFKVIKPDYMLYGAAASGLLYAYVWAFNLPIMLFYGLISFGVGAGVAIPQFAGALLGRYYLRKKLGEEKWTSYPPVLLAGYYCGTGLVVMVGSGISLIISAVSESAIF